MHGFAAAAKEFVWAFLATKPLFLEAKITSAFWASEEFKNDAIFLVRGFSAHDVGPLLSGALQDLIRSAE